MLRTKCAKSVLIVVLIPILGLALSQTAAPALAAADCFGGPCPPMPPPCESGAGVIEGTVTDEAGNAVAGAEVALFSQTAFSFAQTDDYGDYRAEELCAGEYGVQAMLWNGEKPDEMLVGFYDADGDGVPDFVQLPADDATASGIDITLGMIEWELPPEPGLPCEDGAGVVTGTVTDEAGSAVAGAEVALLGELAFFFAQTDDNGDYRAEELCAGDYDVQAIFWDEANPDQVLAGFYDVDGNGEPDLIVLPADDSAVGGIDITLAVIEWELEPLPDLPELPPTLPMPELPPILPMPDPSLPALPYAQAGEIH